jgi:hypothetical protein
MKNFHVLFSVNSSFVFFGLALTVYKNENDTCFVFHAFFCSLVVNDNQMESNDNSSHFYFIKCLCLYFAFFDFPFQSIIHYDFFFLS